MYLEFDEGINPVSVHDTNQPALAASFLIHGYALYLLQRTMTCSETIDVLMTSVLTLVLVILRDFTNMLSIQLNIDI